MYSRQMFGIAVLNLNGLIHLLKSVGLVHQDICQCQKEASDAAAFKFVVKISELISNKYSSASSGVPIFLLTDYF